MREELDKKLCADFPSIFCERHGDKLETCMHWGFECGDGWEPLIRAACLYIENAIENAKSSVIYEYKSLNKISYDAELPASVLKEIHVDKMLVVAEQVKEKYGILMFYWRGENLPDECFERISGAVDMTERLSAITCERCGHPGVLRGPGWLSTECDACAGGKAPFEEYQKWVRDREAQGLEVSGRTWVEFKACEKRAGGIAP